MSETATLRNMIVSFMREDLKNLIGVQSRENTVGNINFPLALCALSYMDFWGKVVSRGSGSGEEQFALYINNYFPPNKKYSAEILWEIFRNGLSHQYFAKNAWVSRSTKVLTSALCRETDSNNVVLDSDTLVNDFLYSLTMVEKDINIDDLLEKHRNRVNVDSSLKFQSVTMQKDIQKLPNCIDTGLFTYSSGASGLPGPVTYTPSQDELIKNLGKDFLIKP